jgi:hypothetical protein
MWKGELASTLAQRVNPRTPKSSGKHAAPEVRREKGCKTLLRDAPQGFDLSRDRDVLGKFYGQATKGVRWMPWRQQTTKDVASCDKPRGAASRL